MNQNDEVIYTIMITGIKSVDMPIVSQKLGYERKQVTTPDSIAIPRLYTRWRGDDSERAWQAELRATIGDKGTVTFDVQPWEHAPGYPKGEM